MKTKTETNYKANVETNVKTTIKKNITIHLNPYDIHKGNLILVNKNFPLCQQNTKNDVAFVPVSNTNSEILLAATAANMLEQLMLLCKVGKDIIPVSGYRSLQEQEQIFADSMREHGEVFTLKFVALPNHSEHQTGLAIDVAENTENIDFICPVFPYEGICQEFRMKAARYGFIERYSEGKEEITGISHEPWHFRYVGYPHSEIIKNNDYSLEEYIDFLKEFPYDGKHLLFENEEQKIEIFYVKSEDKSRNSIVLPENIPYQISGNNSDGFIITVWRTRE